MYDILIVGGGTAGLTAALYARRAGRSVLVLEGGGFGGQITASPLVENYPGIPSISGMAFADALTGQALDLGADAELERVAAARRTGDGFVLTAGGRSFSGRALVLATGAKHRKLGLSGEERLVGNGVSYCAVCDGAFFAGEDVAVAGGGDSALQAALFLSKRCGRVYLVHRREEFRAEPCHVAALKKRENITLCLSRQVTALEGADSLTGVELTAAGGVRERLPVTGLFVAVGQEPDNRVFAELAELDAAGYVRAGEDCRTSTPGVFAAGDCRTKELRQLTTAAADGAQAAAAACSWLDQAGL